ncbi:MAG: hypothetical protein ACPGWR_00495, partial [Ardenticatenaceae bacterium]
MICFCLTCLARLPISEHVVIPCQELIHLSLQAKVLLDMRSGGLSHSGAKLIEYFPLSVGIYEGSSGIGSQSGTFASKNLL